LAILLLKGGKIGKKNGIIEDSSLKAGLTFNENRPYYKMISPSSPFFTGVVVTGGVVSPSPPRTFDISSAVRTLFSRELKKLRSILKDF